MKKWMFLIFVFVFLIGFDVFGYSFGSGVSKNCQRPVIDSNQKKIIEENNGAYIGPDDNHIYLTFDCGYENGYTKDILDVLRKTNTKAVFFITKHYLESAKDIVKIMIDDGHIIGNHTSSHRDFTKLSEGEILNDIKELEDSFYDEFEIEMSRYVRPPRGEFNKMSQEVLAKNGYVSVFWSLAYVDWNKDVFNGNKYSYNKVMERIHNGAIILMHTVSKDNSVDLYDIIIDLKDKGYVFETMDYLFRPRLLI